MPTPITDSLVRCRRRCTGGPSIGVSPGRRSRGSRSTSPPRWRRWRSARPEAPIVFAAAGAEHEAITSRYASERIENTEVVRGAGYRQLSVTFRIGPSHDVLPAWKPRPLDLVLVDGAHGFPYPVIDWWHVAPHVRVGGLVLLDDVFLPAVGSIVDFVRASPSWKLEPAVSFRTALARKLRRRASRLRRRIPRRHTGECGSHTCHPGGASSRPDASGSSARAPGSGQSTGSADGAAARASADRGGRTRRS